MTTQPRKIILALTILYTMVILYFIFLAFGRLDTIGQMTDYPFLFVPDSFFKLPSIADLLHPTLMDFVDFGNIAAFIPFGVLIPLLYRTSFVRFIAWFLLSILVLETIQALTLLGSFDVNDVMQNSSGAAIGFGAYKLGMRTKNVWRNIAATGISIAILMIGVWGFCAIVDKVFTKEAGPFVALHEPTDSTGNPATGTKPYVGRLLACAFPPTIFFCTQMQKQGSAALYCIVIWGCIRLGNTLVLPRRNMHRWSA
ncbi:VanZ family protein [Brevibacillus parabrevis]|uniref:VanZ family protein n=1 Tax=Brevibacillus parabrevis TaxID=54914 RepID=UPI0028D53235|nr:VanZ family protein [Brevibacillus parabrevis]MED1724352.1 VanZ family protein [Brevibacillus parabrevis]